MIITGLKIRMAKNFIMDIVLIETCPSRLAHLVLRDFDAGRHGGLFDDRRPAVADSWPSLTGRMEQERQS
jgi:hypothetical protein